MVASYEGAWAGALPAWQGFYVGVGGSSAKEEAPKVPAPELDASKRAVQAVPNTGAAGFEVQGRRRLLVEALGRVARIPTSRRPT